MEANFGSEQIGEKRLLIELLDDSLKLATFTGFRSNKKRKLCAEALDWIVNPDYGESAFWFVNVCDFLGYKPGLVRIQVERALVEGRQIKMAKILVMPDSVQRPRADRSHQGERHRWNTITSKRFA